MESGENSNSTANNENEATHKDEKAYVSSSTSPKRYKLDTSVPLVS